MWFQEQKVPKANSKNQEGLGHHTDIAPQRQQSTGQQGQALPRSAGPEALCLA